MPEDLKPRAFGVLLPTLTLLLDPSSDGTTSALHTVATTALLGLAQTGPQAFKDATQAMDEGDRGILEKAVRDAVGQRASQSGPGSAGEKRVIELKSFG